MVHAFWDFSSLVEMTQNNKLDPDVKPSTPKFLQGDPEQMFLSSTF